ncbi:MAG: effector-associated domain EAD1-containing protein, partial [Candidatus Promineifilaceae bacterium]
NQTELRNTIIEPLERVSDGITFGDRLVAQIINDLEQSSLTLPHMQLICSELFRLGKEEDRTLNINDYQILGGVKGVLSNYLMRTLSGMSYKKQAQAREFLTHLVSEHGRRLSTSISQVIEASHYNQSDIEDTVHKLREARLIIKYEENGQFLYQLSHDSLTVEIEKWIERIEYVLPTRKNVQMLCAGLTHVFNYQDLLRLIRYEFGIILSHIIPVAGNTYSKIVSDLVYYFALKQEGLNKLLKAAHNSNPDNPLLIHAKQDLEGTHFAALPSLETAILASFRDIIDLQHTIFCYLDINIAEEINLKKRTFKQIIEDVVQFFSASESGLDWLVAALRNSNPKNQLLSAVEEAYRMIGRITIPVKELWLSPLSQIRRLICQKLPMAEIDSIVRDNLDIEIHNLIVGASKLNLVAALLIQIRDESNKLLHLVESLAKAIPDLAELMPLYKQYRSFTSPLTDTNELSVEGKAVAYAISQSLNIEMLQRIVRWEFDRALFEIVPPVGVTFEEQVLYLVEAYSSSIEDLEHFVERVLNSEQINAPNNALLAKIFANLRAGPTVISSILASANLKSE